MRADIRMLALMLEGDDWADASAAVCEERRGTDAQSRLERVRDVLTRGIEAINQGRGRIASGLDRMRELCTHVQQSTALMFGRNASRTRHHIDGMLSDLAEHIEGLQRRRPGDVPQGALRSEVVSVAASLRSVINMLLSMFGPSP